MEAPVELANGGINPFSHIRVLASTAGNRHVFYGDVDKNSIDESVVIININNIYDDLSGLEVNEASLCFQNQGTQAYFKNTKRCKILNGGNISFDKETGHIRIFEIDGII